MFQSHEQREEATRGPQKLLPQPHRGTTSLCSQTPSASFTSMVLYLGSMCTCKMQPSQGHGFRGGGSRDSLLVSAALHTYETNLLIRHVLHLHDAPHHRDAQNGSLQESLFSSMQTEESPDSVNTDIKQECLQHKVYLCTPAYIDVSLHINTNTNTGL